MKATGIVRRIDDLGRVVVPKELRRVLGIKEGDPVEFYSEADKVVIKKYQPGCVLCNSVDKPLTDFCGKEICHDCIKALGKKLGSNPFIF